VTGNPHQVLNIRWFNDDVYELTLERNDCEFSPGDNLALFNADCTQSRPYSIASGAAENVLRFVIRRVPGGEVSGHLSEREAGDIVHTTSPFGWFRPGQMNDDRPFTFLATGTGIAPFLSYLRSFPDQPPKRCLYGIRQLDDAVDIAFLENICGTELAISREERPEYHHGRITDLLTANGVDTSMHYYLCGLDAMIDEASEFLENNGVDFSQIHREVFFYAAP
jgi:ferredoxin-NADP reductase